MKIRNSLAILCSAAFCFALTLSGCKNKNNTSSNGSSGGGDTSSGDTSGGSQQVWTVTFDSQGGSPVAPQQVNHGEKVTKPADPTRSGFDFTGWFKEAAAQNEYNFGLAVRSDLTLYAGWQTQTPPAPTNCDYYATVGGQEYGLVAQEGPLLDSQTGEWRAEIGTVTAGQAVVIMNSSKVALADNFGAEPGDNNVSGEVGNFTIHNDAENVFLIVKTWESGWTNFYISGYEAPAAPTPHGPEGSVAVEWFIVGQGNTALFPNSWSWVGAVQLYTNPGSTDIGCIFGVTFTEGDLFKLYDAHSSWVGFNSLLSSSPCYSCFEGSAGIGSDPNIKCKTTVVCNVFYTSEGKIYITPYSA